MRETAKDKLHTEDQILEPLFGFNSSFLVLPANLYRSEGEQLLATYKVKSEGTETLITAFLTDIKKYKPENNYILTIFKGAPQKHGIIRNVPKTIFELNNLLNIASINLIDEFRNRLKIWYGLHENHPFFNSNLIIVVYLPQTRHENSSVESYDIRAFKTEKSINEIGLELGVWEKKEGNIGLIMGYDKNKDGAKLNIEMLNVCEPFSKSYAQMANNVNIKDSKISVIGLGALGSQIYNILLRKGIGNWILIDNDIVLPHNFARHILAPIHTGYHKASVLSYYAKSLYQNPDIANYISINIFDKKNDKYPELLKALETSEIILDFSASVSVARYITLDIPSKARRISAFYSISGIDSILLAEDNERKYRLDFLEMQYYRFLVETEELHDHLINPIGKLRYGYSCRDVSAKIPFDLTVQHSGVCSECIKNLLSNPKALINIWRTNDGNIKKYEVSISNPFMLYYEDWIVCCDDYFIKKVYSEREKKLPNETGGVMLGSYDKQRKIIYVVDIIPSPDDSIEWPNVYIRGIKGIQNKIERIEKITDNMITYIGEWHSHPKGCQPSPSKDDVEAFLWLTKVMVENGTPALMLIAGKGFNFYLTKIVEN